MKTNFKIFLLLASCFLLFTSCKKEIATDPAISFQALLEANVDPRSLPPGLSVHVEAPKHQISWAGAAGVSETGTKNKVEVLQPYRIASITKTFVATCILLLSEQGKLSIDDPISRYISQEHISILQQDNYELEKITIRHCLHHTSGLFDYAMSEDYRNMVFTDEQHRWTRTEQLEGAIKWGDPICKPGKEYHYSDTGYILLGEIIENIHGENLGIAARELIGYEKLGMDHTWWEILELEPDNMLPQVGRYSGSKNITAFDFSIDLYGGGGIVSTSTDLAKFMHHLFNHRIFNKRSTLETMLSKPEFEEGYKPDKDYRLGIYHVSIYGMDAYMHSGIWGTQLMYIPDYEATIAVNHTNWGKYYVIKQVVSLLKEYVEN